MLSSAGLARDVTGLELVASLETLLERTLWTRTWARCVTITNTSNEYGEVTRKDYSDGTPSVTIQYNVLGEPERVSAAEADVEPLLREAVARLEYLTPLNKAVILEKGKAGVTTMNLDKLREAGLVPDSWSLEVVADPASNSVIDQPLSRADGKALTWRDLMSLAETRAVRFLHVWNCTNGPHPFHMALWEGVPLREVVLLAR